MSRISEIRIKETQLCYIVSIRKTINFMKEYSSFFGESISKVSNYLEKNSVLTSSAAMACFHNMDLEHLDIEVGFYVAHEIPNTENITCKISEPYKVVTTIDMGPYEKQDSTLMEIFEYIKEHNLEMQGPIFYYYLNEPNRKESEYLTQMDISVK